VNRTSYEAPHYAVFSSLPSFPPSQVTYKTPHAYKVLTLTFGHFDPADGGSKFLRNVELFFLSVRHDATLRMRTIADASCLASVWCTSSHSAWNCVLHLESISSSHRKTFQKEWMDIRHCFTSHDRHVSNSFSRKRQQWRDEETLCVTHWQIICCGAASKSSSRAVNISTSVI